jgi:CRP-like cAMP-binding protein
MSQDPAIAQQLPTVNHLLRGLPSAEVDAVLGRAERVRFRLRQEVYPQDGVIDHAYFPEGGVFSSLMETSAGTVEVLTTGAEGMLGLPAVMGSPETPTRTICQVAGWTSRIPIEDLITGAAPGGLLHNRLLRYAQALVTSLSRSVACNRLHSASQRYARWVLTTQDRVGTEEFSITQEFLGQMLGVTRPTVSQVGQELQAAGLIHYERGRLTIDDREGLEQVSCDCYAAVRSAFIRLLGEPIG